MQMKNRKRFLALVAAAAMVIAPCSAFAASTTTTTSSAISGIGTGGTGTNEGWIDKTYFSVTYPTTVDGELDFVLDPQKLISDNQGTAVGGHDKTKFETGETLFFNYDGTNYKHYTKDYVLEAKSSTPVDISVSATVSCSSIEVTTDSAIKTSTDTSVSVYIALTTATAVDGTMAANATPADPSTKAATMSAKLEALPDSSFEVTSENGAYKYDLTTAAKGADGKKFTFHMEGAANPNADWKNYVDIQPTIDLVWSVSPDLGMQTITDNTQKLAWSDRTQPYSFKVNLSSFNAGEISDLGCSYKGTIYDYNSSWKGGGNLSRYDLAELNGDTITLKTGFSEFLPSGATGGTDGLFIKFDNDPDHWILLKME